MSTILESDLGHEHQKIKVPLPTKKKCSNACKKWEKMQGKDIERTKVFAGIKKIREIKLRWFKTKICYRILLTNSILKDMGVVENNVCNFYSTKKDTIFHFMCQCEHTQSFWVRFEMCLKEKSFNCARFSINPTHSFRTWRKNDDRGRLWLYSFACNILVYKCRLYKLKPTLEALNK